MAAVVVTKLKSGLTDDLAVAYHGEINANLGPDDSDDASFAVALKDVAAIANGDDQDINGPWQMNETRDDRRRRDPSEFVEAYSAIDTEDIRTEAVNKGIIGAATMTRDQLLDALYLLEPDPPFDQ